MSDLIERDKAIDVLDDFQSDIENCVTDAYAIARQRMTVIPSADVPTTATGVIDAIHNAEYRGYMKAVEDRPKGEWIGGRVGHSPGYMCSICGYGVQPWNNTNYCPNCGAHMKGADDE